MTTALTDNARKMIQMQGFGMVGEIGGQPKARYWTPDGRQIMAPPSLHEFVRKDSTGKIINSGVRDSNLDRGWLTTKPEVLKPYCSHCDRWHDTDKEVIACGKRLQDTIRKAEMQAKKSMPMAADGRLDKVEKDVGEIKDMLMKLLERK